MSKLFLGVDGGGSKTELCVADGSGKTLLTLNGGATSFKSVGNAAAFANMRELVRQMERAGFRAEHIQRSVWGMSGCDTPADRVVYEAMIQQAGFPEAQTTVVNDALLPFWAAAGLRSHRTWSCRRCSHRECQCGGWQLWPAYGRA